MDGMYQVASDFREAIKAAINNREIDDCNMRRFPNGCCTYASRLLQRFLHEQYGIETFVFSGQYGYGVDGESHAWLETEEQIVIDITGDQFSRKVPTFNCPVYVGSRENGFHDLFDMNKPEPYSIETSSIGPTIQQEKMDRIYDAIIRNLSR